MSEAGQALTVVIPLSVKLHGGRKAVVTPGAIVVGTRQDVTLIKAVARAFRWRRMLEAGRFATIKELATAEKINSSYVSRVLRLTLLAPDIVEAILDGQQPEGMTLPGLMEGAEVKWERQKHCVYGRGYLCCRPVNANRRRSSVKTGHERSPIRHQESP
jgi:hypothetical protein